MKKFAKIAAIFTGILIVIAGVAFLVLLNFLPSPHQIGQYLKPSNAKTALKQLNNGMPSSTEVTPPPTSGANDEIDDESDSERGKTSLFNNSTEEDQRLIEDLMDTQKPLSDVCGSLHNANKIHMNGYTLKEFGQGYKDGVIGNEKDPAIQAVKPSLKFVFSQESVRALVEEAMEAAENEKEGGLSAKAGFYAKAFAAYRDLQRNKTHIEGLMDRSYHLMILSKVIAKKPELLGDPATNTFCSDIETAINSNQPTSFTEERSEFNRFIKDSGVDPKAVGYDPQYQTKLDIEMSQSHVGMSGGWIDDELLKPSPEEIQAIQDEAKKK